MKAAGSIEPAAFFLPENCALTLGSGLTAALLAMLTRCFIRAIEAALLFAALPVRFRFAVFSLHRLPRLLFLTHR